MLPVMIVLWVREEFTIAKTGVLFNVDWSLPAATVDLIKLEKAFWYDKVYTYGGGRQSIVMPHSCLPPTVMLGLQTSMKWGLNLPAVTLQTFDSI